MIHRCVDIYAIQSIDFTSSQTLHVKERRIDSRRQNARRDADFLRHIFDNDAQFVCDVTDAGGTVDAGRIHGERKHF